MPLSVVHRLSLGEVLPTAVTLQMADISMARLEGVLEDVLVKVGKFIFSCGLYDHENGRGYPSSYIARNTLLAIGVFLIDVQKGELTLRVEDEAVHFNLNKGLEQPNVDVGSCMAVENSSHISVELNSDCNLQHSINEIEMNFQYLESIDNELLPSSLQNKETVLSLNENSQEHV